MIKATRIGHASVLLEFDGTRLLTDPWFSEKSGYHPGEGPGLEIAELPRLDAVVVSHGHYDHYDMAAFSAYGDHTVPVFVKRGTASTAREAGFANVRELDWWEQAVVGGVTITAAPAKHGVPENTYLFESASGVVYFAGDTLLIPELDEVHRRHPAIDLLLVSINGLRVKPMLNRKMVMDAEDAAELTRLLSPAMVIPMHYAFESRNWFHDTFLISYSKGPERFVDACARRGLESIVRVARPGEEVTVAAGSSHPVVSA